MFSSKSEIWGTPIGFFKLLDKRFNFTLDAAASAENAKCIKFFTIEDDALVQDWANNIVFCNPPYGRKLKKWVEKFHREGLKENTTVVALIPARTDTIYFHKFCRHAKEIIFIKGRIKFEGENGAVNPAPFPSMVVVFQGHHFEPRYSYMNAKWSLT